MPYPKFETELKSTVQHMHETFQRREEEFKQFMETCFEKKQAAFQAKFQLGPDLRRELSMKQNPLDVLRSSRGFIAMRGWLVDNCRDLVINEELHSNDWKKLRDYVAEGKVGRTRFSSWFEKSNGKGYSWNRIENFYAQAREDMARGTTRPIILSANPLDLLMLSTNAGFTSCLKMDSLHSMGGLQYAEDQLTLVMMLPRAGESLNNLKVPIYKEGRALLYNKENTYLFGRGYGVNSTTVLNWGEALRENLPNLNILPRNNWKTNFDFNRNNVKNIGVRDAHVGHMGFFDRHELPAQSGPDTVFEFPAEKCWNCEKNHNNSDAFTNGRQAICSYCLQRQGFTASCSHAGCGSYCYAHTNSLGNKVYCDRHLAEYSKPCACCNKILPRSKHVPDVCNDCFKTHYVKSLLSGTYFRKEECRQLFNIRGEERFIGKNEDAKKSSITYFETENEAWEAYSKRVQKLNEQTAKTQAEIQALEALMEKELQGDLLPPLDSNVIQALVAELEAYVAQA